jgi:type II secretion system protein C
MDAFNIIANNRLWNKHGVKLVWLLALLLLALTLLSIGWTTWRQAEIKQTNYQPQTIAPIKITNKPTYQVNDIVTANLFGDPTPAPVVKVAPKTTLDLTLVGVLWSSDNSVGRAIIMSGKKAPELYSLGESIKGAGAKVEEIRNGEVILNRNGALESLPINKLIDSSNRIVVSFPDELEVDSFEDDSLENYIDDHSSVDIEPDNSEINNNIQVRTSDSGKTQRVRRPNFSGLDRALEKMGEL